jgi:hypothetical protein
MAIVKMPIRQHPGSAGKPNVVYECNYCRRGSSEIKEIDDKLDNRSLPDRQPSQIVPENQHSTF